MKVKLLVYSGVLMVVFFAFWVYGNSLITVGERESRWIIQDMWGANYFNVRLGGIEEYERINLLSLQEGSSKNQELITYVVKNKCNDGSERCYLIMTSASNLLIDGAEYDSGLRGVVEAVSRVKAKNFCPIAYESAIIKYKIKMLSSKGIDSARSASRNILKKIKLNGGLMKSLKTESCINLSKIKPEYFHEYAVLVAHLMGFAGGDLAKAGAYINSSAQ
ncbi:hypothetical protein HP532_21090 [Pseudomonas sp. CrR25]|nr:hypothetical protein [Pseudomonas sp. CrR25]